MFEGQSATFTALLLFFTLNTFCQEDFYFSGPLIATQHYKEKELKQINGDQYYYHPSGYLDSSGKL